MKYFYNEIFYDENELKRKTQNVDCKLLKWFLTSTMITFYLENKNDIALADNDYNIYNKMNNFITVSTFIVIF